MWPASWKARIRWSGIARPTWMSGEVTSIPSFTRSGRSSRSFSARPPRAAGELRFVRASRRRLGRSRGADRTRAQVGLRRATPPRGEDGQSREPGERGEAAGEPKRRSGADQADDEERDGVDGHAAAVPPSATSTLPQTGPTVRPSARAVSTSLFARWSSWSPATTGTSANSAACATAIRTRAPPRARAALRATRRARGRLPPLPALPTRRRAGAASPVGRRAARHTPRAGRRVPGGR